MRELVRENFRFFLWATLSALVLRFAFFLGFPAVTSDSFVYGDIAKNWLQHGIYGLSGINDITPTSIRLPGYPAFLAAVFAVFGVEHYRAVLFVQIFVDIGSCFLIADIARRVVSPRAARAAFMLAALCPFFANYAAAALTETWEIFFTVLALDLVLVGRSDGGVRVWWGCGFAIGAAILLRPDGGLLLAAIELFVIAHAFVGIAVQREPEIGRAQLRGSVKVAAIIAFSALVPLLPWTLRNWHTFHEFQPLAPRYANEENSFVPMGFNRWVKTWMADYASVEEVYWSVPGNTIDIDNLPLRAFDSPEQRDQTEQLVDDYNQSRHVTPELDARFAALAAERVRHSHFRYYIWLPMLRIADMWLRPRTEILPCNTRWWEFDEDRKWLVLGVIIGALNLLYVAAGAIGLVRGRFVPGFGLLVTFLVLRSLFLGTLENPEPRYTLECYPVLLILAAVCFRPRPDRPALD